MRARMSTGSSGLVFARSAASLAMTARLCEERSDEAIHLTVPWIASLAVTSGGTRRPPPLAPPHRGEGDRCVACCRFDLRRPRDRADTAKPCAARLCEERSDEAIHMKATMDCFALLAMTSGGARRPPPLAPPHRGEGDR